LIKEILKYLSQKYGSEFCLLRDFEQLSDLESMHDIDCYLPRTYIPALQDELERCFNVTCYLQIHKINFSSIIIISDLGFIKFDFDHRFSWRGLVYIENDLIEKSTVAINGINCLNSHVSLAQRIIKDILGRGQLPKEKIKSLIEIRKDILSSNSNVSSSAILKYIHSLSIEYIANNSALVRKNIIKIIIIKNLRTPLKCMIMAAEAVYYKFFKPTGKLIVLIGPDGSGKSSMSDLLSKNLERNWFTHVVQYYSRPGILPALNKIFSRWLPSNSKTKDEPDNSSRMINLIPGLIKITYYTFDFVIFWFQLYNHKIRNELVVFDRYFYDYEIQFYYKNISPKYKRFLKIFIPRPDAIIVLSADPEEIVRRKPELELSTIEYQYKNIFALHDKNIFVVRTDKVISETFKELVTGCAKEWRQN
jgi:thymidylate kinase